MALKLWSALFSALLCACANPREARVPEATFTNSEGARARLLDRNARFTVLEFFSAHCPCQTQHDARLAALHARYAPRGVAFLAIDSEADATIERDRAEVARRNYPYAIMVDPEGIAARSLRANYATYVVLVDSQGRVLFRGGIDSDRSHLTADATPYLANALADAVAGRPVQRAEAKTLGCSLMLR